MNESRTLAPQMIGRDQQLHDLGHAFDLARRGEGRVVFIAGEAGGGKTRLLREFLSRAQAASAPAIFEGYCYDEEPAVPYGPFIDALRRMVRSEGVAAFSERVGPWLSDLSKLLPELASSAAQQLNDLDGQMQKRRLFEAIYQCIRPQQPGECRILALEDVHWSDQTSQELLRYLARAIDRDAVLVLCTYRRDEIHRRHPFTQLVAHLTRERLYNEVHLPPLSQVDVAALMGSMVDRPLSSEFINALYQRTEGNPFFIEEIIKSLLDTQRLDLLNASSQPGSDLGGYAVPHSIKASILSSTQDLDEQTTMVLNYAAVVGRRFSFETLLQLTHLSEAELLPVLERLVTLRLIDEDDAGFGDEYRFRHELIREAIYDDLLGRERRMKHREVLAVLEAQSAEQTIPISQLAYHSLQARESPKASLYAHRAADEAARMYAYREALTQYETALELLDSADDVQRADLLYKLGETAMPLGDPRAAAGYWREAQELYRQLGNPHRLADTYRRLGRIAWDQGDRATAFSDTQTAISLIEDKDPSQALVMAYSALSQLHMLAGQPTASIEWGSQAIDLARTLGEEALTAHSMNNIGVSLVELGDVAEGIALLEQSLELAKQAGLVADVIRAHHNLGGQLIRLGEIARGAVILREGLAYSEQMGWTNENMIIPQLSWVELELGNWQAAQTMLNGLFQRRNYGLGALPLHTVVTQCQLWIRQGRLDEARDLLEPLVQANRLEEKVALGAWTVLAQLYKLTQQESAAIQALDRALAIWQKLGSGCEEGLQIAAVISLYTWTAQADKLQSIIDAVRANPEPSSDPVAVAVRTTVEGIIALSEQRWRDAAAYFAQAVIKCQALGFVYQAACAQQHLAEAYLRSAEAATHTEAISAALHAAHDTFERLGARLDLAAVEALIRQHNLRRPKPASGRTLELTPRETQVIALLARGLSNRAIAEELVISPKTAEIHVSNILGKLALSSRAQVAAYAVEQGLLSRPEQV
jgi:ATP/maltotriose-dependent transcriptional regulator MalT